MPLSGKLVAFSTETKNSAIGLVSLTVLMSVFKYLQIVGALIQIGEGDVLQREKGFINQDVNSFKKEFLESISPLLYCPSNPA